MALPTSDDLTKLPSHELLTALTQVTLMATLGHKKANIPDFDNETPDEIARFIADLSAEIDSRLKAIV